MAIRKTVTRQAGTCLFIVPCLLLLLACSPTDRQRVDRLNSISYSFHYRNLDSTAIYAQRALSAARGYDGGQAEAYNNLAFVSIARMDYTKAQEQLDAVDEVSDNQIESLVSDVQYMRLCQLRAHNKDFYYYRERAKRHLLRIEEEGNFLSERQRLRMIYAKSEYDIVSSVYFHYVGLDDQATKALEDIDQNGDLKQDTTQLLNYWTKIGLGRMVTHGTISQIHQEEFDHFMQCYQLAVKCKYYYWEALALHGISELLQVPGSRRQLLADNVPGIKYINIDNMPDSLLAGNLSQRALNILSKYGDVYQTAMAYSSLARCFFDIHDYKSAFICLRNALDKDTVINRAPDMVATIREQLCLVYSAVNQKPLSDYNRNKYLDIQERTRQDRQLEARAGQLYRSSHQLNVMILAVIVMIFVVTSLLLVFGWMRKRNDKKYSLDMFLVPLSEWKVANNKRMEEHRDKYESVKEAIRVKRLQTKQHEMRNVEQRAKVSLVNSITLFIDRMMNETRSLLAKNESEEVRQGRYAYITQLVDKINEYNNVLTEWIQLRQGELSVHVESFPLRQLFDFIAKSDTSFQLKGINLVVSPSDEVVKADKALTLFMINTMADNARKFTPAGGTVTISAEVADNYVEISVEDTGIGIDDEQKAHVFDHKCVMESMEQLGGITGREPSSTQHSHGFGLVNCKGILDKYRKTSQIFNVCDIGVDSEVGKGSRFYFRIPRGVVRTLLIICVLTCHMIANAGHAPAKSEPLPLNIIKAAQFADSAYFSNINGTYAQTLILADSCFKYLNKDYAERDPKGKDLIVAYSDRAGLPAELKWAGDTVQTDYNVILDVRNEAAVAALALHEWDLYRYNNMVYIRLFRETSSDNTLSNYVRVMQKSEGDKNIAIVILVLLLILILPAYYFIYYRYHLRYRYSVDSVRLINGILLGDDTPGEKLDKISKAWDRGKFIIGLSSSELDTVVEQIKEALRHGIEYERSQNISMELAEDELRRVELENYNLHVCNNVLDNCLSTLKHETMYYPYRIRQLIDGASRDVKAMYGLVCYYRDLFSVLSTQATRQMLTVGQKCRVVNMPSVCDMSLLGDENMLAYLFCILRKKSGVDNYITSLAQKDERYVVIDVAMPGIRLTDEQCNELFQPSTVDIQFLICRQIIRDIGEAADARGSGIVARRGEAGDVSIEVTLVRAFE